MDQFYFSKVDQNSVGIDNKHHLIAEVATETAMLRTKLALGRIKDDEKARLNAWLDYLDLLEAVDTSLAPDIDWPKKTGLK